MRRSARETGVCCLCLALALILLQVVPHAAMDTKHQAVSEWGEAHSIAYRQAIARLFVEDEDLRRSVPPALLVASVRGEFSSEPGLAEWEQRLVALMAKAVDRAVTTLGQPIPPAAEPMALTELYREEDAAPAEEGEVAVAPLAHAVRDIADFASFIACVSPRA